MIRHVMAEDRPFWLRLDRHLPEEGFARITVRDDGGGIPKRELDNLFDGRLKSHRLPDGDGKRNMGLGLSVCRAIVLAHGGTITAKNLLQGAELSFRLPTVQQEVSL